MRFPFNVYCAAFAAGFAVTLLSLPGWRAWALHTGLVDDPGGRKIHAAPIPLAGGLAVMTGLLAPLLAAAGALALNVLDGAVVDQLRYGFARRAPQLGAILAGALAMVALGWLDDKHELRPALKFVSQLLIAALVAGAGVRITLFVESKLFSYAVTIL